MPPITSLKRVSLMAVYVSAGVKVDGGGFIIVNGKVIKVPPRGPALRQLRGAIEAIVAGAGRSGR